MQNTMETRNVIFAMAKKSVKLVMEGNSSIMILVRGYVIALIVGKKMASLQDYVVDVKAKAMFMDLNEHLK